MDLPVERVLRPRTLGEAAALLAADADARPLAGGTDLVVQLRDGRRRAPVLVDLSNLGLTAISERDGGVEIGAGCTMAAIAAHRAVQRVAPALAAAAAQVGAWPIQCRATLGGNLANASPAADTAPPLLVAEAVLAVVGPAGERRLGVDELFLGPGVTSLASGELITSVFVPGPSPGLRAIEHFTKVGPRREQVIAVASLAGRAEVKADGTLQRIRLALGSVAPTPMRARCTENRLAGLRPDAAARRAALACLCGEIAPIDDLRAPARYRLLAAAALLERFLETCGG